MTKKTRKTANQLSLQQAIELIGPYLDRLDHISPELNHAIATIKAYSVRKKGRPEIFDRDLLLFINKKYDPGGDSTAFIIVSNFVNDHYESCVEDKEYMFIENGVRVNKNHLVRRLTRKYKSERDYLFSTNKALKFGEDITNTIKSMRPISIG